MRSCVGQFRCPLCGVMAVADSYKNQESTGQTKSTFFSMADKMGSQPEQRANVVPTLIIEPMHVDCENLQTRPLPRADGGKDAWLVLAGCFVLEVLVWGYASRIPSMKAEEIWANDIPAFHTLSASSKTTTPPMSPSTAAHLALPPSQLLRAASCSSHHHW